MVSYHGDWGWTFPEHPHTGFETVTCVLPGTRGFVDHFDSLDNAGRYGPGDVQWMTAGRGVSHSEVSVHEADDDKADRSYRPMAGQAIPTGWLFQLWLNLPTKSKLAPPTARMLWDEEVPVFTMLSEGGRRTTVRTIAGKPPCGETFEPPPHSWAADPENAVQILHVWMEGGAVWEFLRAADKSNCLIYVFGGEPESAVTVSSASISAETVKRGQGAHMENTGEVRFQFRAVGSAEILILEGMPIGEPVVWHGPMVTESDGAMAAAMTRYFTGQMGKWQHEDKAPVHQGEARFAKYGDRMGPPPNSTSMHPWPADPSCRL